MVARGAAVVTSKGRRFTLSQLSELAEAAGLDRADILRTAIRTLHASRG